MVKAYRYFTMVRERSGSRVYYASSKRDAQRQADAYDEMLEELQQELNEAYRGENPEKEPREV